jgi:hypothetical protein
LIDGRADAVGEGGGGEDQPSADRVLTALRLVVTNRFAELEDVLLEGMCLLHPAWLDAVLFVLVVSICGYSTFLSSALLASLCSPLLL